VENRGRRESVLQGVERDDGFRCPLEALLAKQLGEWRRSGTEVTYEAAVISDQPQKCPYCPHGGRDWPGQYRPDLLVHSHAVCRDHVAKVGDAPLTEEALGSFEEELVFLQLLKNKMDVPHVLGLGGAVNQNVVEED
jgi:hypothetical protein